ncbi:MAG: HAD family hydrolase [Terracidiphilus sp.]
MALRAVVFDYGRVLTGPPDPAAHAALVRIAGLPVERFESLYWADRPGYDAGQFTGLEFWRRFARAAGLSLPPSAIEQLNQWDVRMWAGEDRAMLAWQLQLKQRGLLTAILSNMGDDVYEYIARQLDWLNRFDLLVWSYQLRVVKPNPVIYRHALDRLGIRAEEALFLDDKPENVEAAATLGMRALVFSTIGNLRADLIALKLDSELPLPA